MISFGDFLGSPSEPLKKKLLGCSKKKKIFPKFLFIAFDVWEQSERIGLKLDALLMRLEVIRQGSVDLVKR
jgi:hypothetical protein